jgi:p-cumate 2,3-dioxygenase beta subunit
MSRSDLRLEVEEFLFDEADLLDDWRLMEWADLFTEDGRYLVAPTGIDHPETLDPEKVLFLVADDRERVRQRAIRLLKKGAHAEYPHSRTRHLVSNIRVPEPANGEIRARANFVTFRTKGNLTMEYMGRHHYRLVKQGDAFRIREKRTCLDLNTLTPQGRVTIIL